MKVTASSVELQSSHRFAQSLETRERLEVWRGTRDSGSAAASTQPPVVALSAAGQNALAAESATAAVDAVAEEAVEDDPRLAMLIRMIEFLTGEPVRRFSMRDLQSADAAEPGYETGANPGTSGQAGARRAGFGLEYDFSSRFSETETIAFGAAGVVRTADGAEIRFELGFEISRSYTESVAVSVRAGDQRLKDPLVLDFGGPAAALSEVRFDFDLDSDGTREKLPLVSGSGFLAFDRNANGRIDDGRELFGPASGDGFSELARLDDDANGWIDEADAAWSQLRVWRPDAAGKGSVRSLSEVGVGALHLGRVATPFSLKGAAHDTQGVMRASGVYLREDGGVGTLSQVDLKV